MKAVLMSIRPKWCGLIANGNKKVEVRKTKPKLETPFKVYIYCTKDYSLGEFYTSQDDFAPKVQGKIIGEFVCDSIDCYTNYSLDKQKGHINRRENLLRSACMTLKDWRDYIGNYTSDFGYAWHISDLVIYDKPKELSEFQQCHKCKHTCLKTEQNKDLCQYHRLTRPPQSWCYVESEVAE